jgi:MFS family permease
VLVHDVPVHDVLVHDVPAAIAGMSNAHRARRPQQGGLNFDSAQIRSVSGNVSLRGNVTMTAAANADLGDVVVSSGERTRVIFASTLGTVFEWYDFYLYVVLAPAFAKLFFPPANDNAALLAAFATYGAGYVIRPLGAVVFGRMGDSTGRKYTFLTTIVFMGLATFCVGLLPTFQDIGWLAPALLVFLRLVQGLAMGGEYGGAAIYVAEYSDPGRRGVSTSWIQATYVIGLILALGLLLICRSALGPDDFARWGWRIPFLASFILLIISVYVRLRLRETPVFQRLKDEGKETKSPVAESFLHPMNSLSMILAVFGAVGGASVVTITANFYTLFFLSTTMQVDLDTTYVILIPVLTVSILTYLFFGWLSDKIGRLKIILTGSLLAALTLFPLFHVLAVAVNPDLVRFQQETPVTVTVDESTCGLHVFIGPWTKYSTCDHVGDILTRSGVNFTKTNAPGADNVVVSVGGQTAGVSGTDRPAITRTLQSALVAAGYPGLSNDRRGAGRSRFRAETGRHNEDKLHSCRRCDIRSSCLRRDAACALGGFSCRAVSGENPLRLHVVSLSDRLRLGRRQRSAGGDRHCRHDR